MKREALRDKILDATLAHVPFDGWSQTALRAGAEDAGLRAVDAARAFPGGPMDALDHFLRRADRRLAESLAREDLDALPVHKRVTLGVRRRFEQNAPHREAIRRAMPIMAMPQNAAWALRSLYHTVDTIWHLAGDRSTDYNFYTKRLLLAGVYSATLLFWLEDQSPDSVDTWAFLDRRIKDTGELTKGIARVREFAERLPDPFRLFAGRAVRR